MRYSLEKPYFANTIAVTFDRKPFPGARDPFIPLLWEYANEFGFEIKEVDRFYQYKLIGDEFDLRFRWNGNFTINIYVPYKRHYDEVKRRIIRICNRLNNDLERNKVKEYDSSI